LGTRLTEPETEVARQAPWKEERGGGGKESQPVACCVPFKYVIISFMCPHTAAKVRHVVYILGVCVMGYFYGMHEMLLKHLSPFAPACRLSLLMSRHIFENTRLAGDFGRTGGLEPNLRIIPAITGTGHRRFDSINPPCDPPAGFFAALQPHGCKLFN